jgi:hypothetical protein
MDALRASVEAAQASKPASDRGGSRAKSRSSTRRKKAAGE